MAALETLVILAVLATAIAVIAQPFLRKEPDPADAGELSKETEDLHRRRESTFSAIKELEFDFKTGKLSRTDFEELDAEYRAEAVQIIEAMDAHETAEREARACECGFISPRGARFCAACGEPLVQWSEAGGSDESDESPQQWCPDCGAELEPHYRFCAGCGLEAHV